MGKNSFKITTFLLFLLTGCSVNYPKVSIDEIIIYKEFYKGGTTASIRSGFYALYGTDTTNINGVDIDCDKSILEDIINNSKTKKNKFILPPKIIGIEYAGEIWIDGKCHWFIFIPPHFMKDVTEGVEFKYEMEGKSVTDFIKIR